MFTFKCSDKIQEIEKTTGNESKFKRYYDCLDGRKDCKNL